MKRIIAAILTEMEPHGKCVNRNVSDSPFLSRCYYADEEGNEEKGFCKIPLCAPTDARTTTKTRTKATKTSADGKYS